MREITQGLPRFSPGQKRVQEEAKRKVAEKGQKITEMKAADDEEKKHVKEQAAERNHKGKEARKAYEDNDEKEKDTKDEETKKEGTEKKDDRQVDKRPPADQETIEKKEATCSF